MVFMEDKEESKSEWITLGDEKSEISFKYEEDEDDSLVMDAKEAYKDYRERMKYLHRFHDLNQEMYPKSKDSDRPPIMDEVGLFQMGFYSSDNEFRNLTKSTLSKVLKNFLDFGSLPDSLFVLGNVRFLTVLFDINDAREQIRAYLTNQMKHSNKSKELVLALEDMLSYPRIIEKEKRVISELIGFLQA